MLRDVRTEVLSGNDEDVLDRGEPLSPMDRIDDQRSGSREWQELLRPARRTRGPEPRTDSTSQNDSPALESCVCVHVRTRAFSSRCNCLQMSPAI